jgi:hypothetical protein
MKTIGTPPVSHATKVMLLGLASWGKEVLIAPSACVEPPQDSATNQQSYITIQSR